MLGIFILGGVVMINSWVKNYNRTPEQRLKAQQRKAQMVRELINEETKIFMSFLVVMGVIGLIMLIWYPILGH